MKNDIILMDINLKNGLNGIEFTKVMRTIPACRKTPFVAVTAFANPFDKGECLSMGLTHYISKPFFRID